MDTNIFYIVSKQLYNWGLAITKSSIMSQELPPLPTSQMYDELQAAYDFFNRELFLATLGKALPGAMITLQRKNGTMGYFSPARWRNRRKPDHAQGKTMREADEIALNPSFITVQTIEETMQTLVHEMAHQYQHHFGAPGRGRYHNAELAGMMEKIGLILSDTGKPGGKQTGDSMSDFPVEGGAFQLACQQFLATTDFAISWLDRFPVTREQLAHTLHQAPEETGIALTEDEIADMGIQIPVAGPKKKTTLKYTCPLCANNVWGKPNLAVACIPCNQTLLTEPV